MWITDMIESMVPRPLQFVREMISRGGPSVSRFSILTATTTLCVCVLILCRAAYIGKSVGAELATVVGGLVTLVGWAYHRGKQAQIAMTEEEGKDQK